MLQTQITSYDVLFLFTIFGISFITYLLKIKKEYENENKTR